MPYLKCKKCHHEWEGAKSSKCDWCGANGTVLEEKTPLERMLEEWEKSGPLVDTKLVQNGTIPEEEKLAPKDTPEKEHDV